MTKGAVTCPHCRSDKARLLTDHHGSVGWCPDCHKPWIPAQRPTRPSISARKAQIVELRRAG